MLKVYERSRDEDRFDLVLTVETIESLHQCEHCGAKLSLRLDQPKTNTATKGQAS